MSTGPVANRALYPMILSMNEPYGMKIKMDGPIQVKDGEGEVVAVLGGKLPQAVFTALLIL